MTRFLLTLLSALFFAATCTAFTPAAPTTAVRHSNIHTAQPAIWDTVSSMYNNWGKKATASHILFKPSQFPEEDARKKLLEIKEEVGDDAGKFADMAREWRWVLSRIDVTCVGSVLACEWVVRIYTEQCYFYFSLDEIIDAIQQLTNTQQITTMQQNKRKRYLDCGMMLLLTVDVHQQRTEVLSANLALVWWSRTLIKFASMRLLASFTVQSLLSSESTLSWSQSVPERIRFDWRGLIAMIHSGI